jgi:hypothetical protein
MSCMQMESVLPGCVVWDMCSDAGGYFLGDVERGGAGPQTHRRPRASSAEGERLA